MNIGIIGYGKMGREVEKVALQKKHAIKFKINSKNTSDLNVRNIENIDVAIEFSNPNSAFENIKFCIKNHTPVICGTTGWTNKIKDIKKICIKNNGTFLHAPNFSVGMNLFFEINNYISKLLSVKHYKASIEEKHHKMKQDTPSGTAIRLLRDMDQYYIEKDNLQKVPIISKRMGKLKGEHIIKYTSRMDEIRISHKARSRKGFAEGAILAAEFIKNRKGVFSMKDVINNL